jgi:diadenosine tetraphosphate (Ap4A) HIT family hydrolase
MSELAKFQQKFRIPELNIKTYRHWIWSLRPIQSTLGACVISARREEPHFSGMTAEECAELAAVVKDVENRLKSAFSYDKINYLMLMMVDPHVHFHAIPRYAGTREFMGSIWQDRNWPKPPDILGSEVTADQAAEMLKVLGAR